MKKTKIDSLKTRKTLLKRLKNQDDNMSWEEFYNLYVGYIYAIILNMPNIPDNEVDDVVQQVILVAWQKLPEFDYEESKGKFRGWLSAVTKNTVRSLLRKKFRQLDRYRMDVPEDDQALTPEIDKIAEREWQKYITDLAWDRIKDRFKPHVAQAFLLLAEGRTPQDVSAEFGISVDTLYVYKFRVQKVFLREIRMLDEEIG